MKAKINGIELEFESSETEGAVKFLERLQAPVKQEPPPTTTIQVEQELPTAVQDETVKPDLAAVPYQNEAADWRSKPRPNAPRGKKRPRRGNGTVNLPSGWVESVEYAVKTGQVFTLGDITGPRAEAPYETERLYLSNYLKLFPGIERIKLRSSGTPFLYGTKEALEKWKSENANAHVWKGGLDQ